MPASTTIGQRFTQLIQQLGLSKNAFALSLDKTATVIQHLVDERNKPGYDLLCKVFEVYPNVSKDWLMLGAGSMLQETNPTELFAAKPAPPAADDPIDLASVPGPPRRRPGTSGHLQPAEVAATVALAAQATQPALPAASEPAPPPATMPAPVPVAPVAPSAPPAFTTPDPAYLAALLQGQHIQHQLALAEQRNQHLLEQQQLLQQMVQILQKAA